MSERGLHERMLDIASRCALRGLGRVEPNPMVGCVLGDGAGVVCGIGHHARFGGPHAEVEAIASCRRHGNETRGMTAWVTLEPCSHVGKTPPCASALIDAGVARVVYVVDDPHEEASGGARVLRDAGVEVVRVEHAASRLVSMGYLSRECLGRAFVLAKFAQTSDGYIATGGGESPVISGECSRRQMHRLRGCFDALLTSIVTVRADDPLLTVRGVHARRTPARVVIDPELEIARGSRLVGTRDRAPVILACREESLDSSRAGELEEARITLMGVGGSDEGIDLQELLERLWSEHGIGSVMTECGEGVLRSLLTGDLVDGVLQYTSAGAIGATGERLARAPLDVIEAGGRYPSARMTTRDGDRVTLRVSSRWLSG
ncbi:MAG: bifunctional diaminohydroxyphosphoribosylaminopyrimidine deaminase/5-amino-6-(5-phosphoribosylamino)uracil reductase RibD [Phycisphaerales bacterium JB043]